MKRYLVTGGAGFIGSHLVDALIARGDRVVVIDDFSTGKAENLPEDLPDHFHLIKADMREAAALQEALAGGLDGLFHLGAVASVPKSVSDWVGTHGVNQTAFIQLLDALGKARSGSPIPVVYASSAAVYGDPGSVTEPLVETQPCQPQTPYGADKLACEYAARVAGQIHGTPSFGLRFFNVYGPRQDPASPYSGVISIFRDRLKADLPVTIFGDGEQVRDFVFVGDVVSILMAAMEKASVDAPVSNVCTGRATSVNELVRMLSQSLNRTPDISYEKARSGDIRFSVGCHSILKSQLYPDDLSRADDMISFEQGAKIFK
ncbi:MAG: NAD-dependent epimerase/dehydratase family protein [Magnetovibrionaceae bacterium]